MTNKSESVRLDLEINDKEVQRAFETGFRPRQTKTRNKHITVRLTFDS